MIRKRVGVVMPTLTQYQRALEAISTVKSVHDWRYYPICNWMNKFSVARSWNHGVNLSIEDGMDYVFVLNDDILLSKFAVDRLVAAMESDPSIGILTAWDYRNNFDNPYSVIEFDPVDHSISGGPDFACFMIRPDAYIEIGPFDEEFKPAYFEDNDYCYRTVISEKWECLALRSAAFYHFGSATQNAHAGAPVVHSNQFEKNRAYYSKKWGGVPGQETFKEPFDGKA